MHSRKLCCCGLTRVGLAGIENAVSVDQLYVFSEQEWAEGLSQVAGPALESKKIDKRHFQTVSQNVLREVITMPENIGTSDGHRALSWL